MAILRDLQTGRVVTLHAEHLVGRSRRCELRLEAPAISSQHATFRWTGTRWVVRDLGSRNGTLLDGALLPAGVHPVAEGMTLSFGTESCAWVLDSATPPTPNAVSIGQDDLQIVGAEGLLALPGAADQPEVNIYPGPQGAWVAEWLDGQEQVVEDLQILTVAGQAWRLHLPDNKRATEVAEPVANTLNTVRFVFDVSRDQEAIQLTVESATKSWDLGQRAHNWLLLLLAKAREEDQDADSSEQGWVYHEDLMRQVRLNEGTVSVYIFRGRQALAECGIEGAQGLVERRRSTRQLRFGATNILIRQH